MWYVFEKKLHETQGGVQSGIRDVGWILRLQRCLTLKNYFYGLKLRSIELAIRHVISDTFHPYRSVNTGSIAESMLSSGVSELFK
jgi:hypothetical protein